MLWGMALFKLGVVERCPVALVLLETGRGRLADRAWPVICFGTSLDIAHGLGLRFFVFRRSPVQLLGESLLIALGWVGAVMLAFKTTWLDPVTRRLAAAGRMAFCQLHSGNPDLHHHFLWPTASACMARSTVCYSYRS